ncbi:MULTISPECIES: hypothetical protein [unclassified Streptomyces]|uniref:hypothetical protein n=1 Tax=unclassified Streptomyces TaxID=2593676 RepID=UPI0019275DFD|nr:MULTISPECIES: hypothetical protein [unclassified Streptomyces]
MTTLRFTLPPAQNWAPVIGAGVMLAVAGGAAALGGVGFAIPVALIALILLVVYFLVMFGSYGQFDEDGIRSRRGIFRNHLTWAEVREVKLDPKSGQCLMAYKNHGRPFKIGAPVSGGFSQDPQYRAKVAQILEFTRSHLG